IPAQLMGAASADVPAIHVPGGPMLDGEWQGQTLGACTDCRRFWQEYRAGTIDEETVNELEAALVRSAGHCMVMGTASTMACCAAGGLPALRKELAPLLEPEAPPGSGPTLGEQAAAAPPVPERRREVIATLDRPLQPEGGLSILRGTLAPDGAVLKHAAASPRLLQHRGPARVFSGPADLAARIDDPRLAWSP